MGPFTFFPLDLQLIQVFWLHNDSLVMLILLLYEVEVGLVCFDWLHIFFMLTSMLNSSAFISSWDCITVIGSKRLFVHIEPKDEEHTCFYAADIFWYAKCL